MRGNLALLLAAFIWGTTFVAQSVGMDWVGPFTYMAARFFLGSIFLFCLWQFSKRRGGEYVAHGWRAGAGAGVIMFAAAAFQQVGIRYTTVGRASFLTCLYIIFVPIVGVALGKKLRGEHIVGALLAIVGLYLLCMQESFALGLGDSVVLLSAVAWTGHILFIGRFAANVDAIEMSLAQVIVGFFLSAAAALLLETWTWANLYGAWTSIAFAGIFSTGVAFTMQIVGQRYAEPAPAAIIMSLESVFGALAGWVLLGQSLSLREIAGCVFMITGMIVTQVYGILMEQRKHAWREVATKLSTGA